MTWYLAYMKVKGVTHDQRALPGKGNQTTSSHKKIPQRFCKIIFPKDIQTQKIQVSITSLPLAISLKFWG